MKAESNQVRPAKTRPEEEWASRVIGRHLSCAVERNDDGSKVSMYDLRVGPEDQPQIAIKCVRDIDEKAIRVWKRGPMSSPIQVQAPGDWVIELGRNADVREVNKLLPSLLARLHGTGEFNAVVDPELQTRDLGLFMLLNQLGIEYVQCADRHGNGKVLFNMTLPGGIVSESANDIADWLTDFISRESCLDNLLKLKSSGAPQRHIFVMPTLNGSFTAPIFHHLEVRQALPQKAPTLPPEITAACIVPTTTHTGLFWDGSSWSVVDGRG